MHDASVLHRGARSIVVKSKLSQKEQLCLTLTARQCWRFSCDDDGALDFREKMTFLRSLNEEQKAAYRKQFAKIGQAKIGPTKSAQPESAEKR